MSTDLESENERLRQEVKTLSDALTQRETGSRRWYWESGAVVKPNQLLVVKMLGALTLLAIAGCVYMLASGVAMGANDPGPLAFVLVVIFGVMFIVPFWHMEKRVDE